MDEPIWAPTVFTKNRDRLLNQEIARSFFRRVVERAQGASHKSFQRKEPARGLLGAAYRRARGGTRRCAATY